MNFIVEENLSEKIIDVHNSTYAIIKITPYLRITK